MNSKCKCGGRMQHKDKNPVYFRMKCDKCGVIHRQKTRKPRKK